MPPLPPLAELAQTINATTSRLREQLRALVAGGKAAVRKIKRAQILLAADASRGDRFSSASSSQSQPQPKLDSTITGVPGGNSTPTALTTG